MPRLWPLNFWARKISSTLHVNQLKCEQQQLEEKLKDKVGNISANPVMHLNLPRLILFAMVVI